MEWAKVNLGQILDVKHGYAFKSKYFTQECASHVLLTPGNFLDEGGFKWASKQKYYEGPVDERFVLGAGDLLVAMTEQAEGLLGSCLSVPGEKRFLHNQRLGKVLCTERLDGGYAYYLLNWSGVRSPIRATSSGTKVRHTSPDRIREIEVPLPSLPIQRRIAGILSAYDDLIEVNTRRIKALEEMARRTYEEWFVHYRFPGGDGTRPREWEEVTLGQIAAVNPTQIKPSAAPDKVSYIDIASVSPGRIDSITPMAFSEAPGRARRIVQRGDTIWSCVRPNRRSHALIGTIPANTLASTGFAVLRPEKVPASWLYLAVTTDLFVSYLENSATGAAYPAVKKEDFINAQSDLPPLDILEAFELLAGPILELVDSLLQQNTNLRAQRDLLLPRLVSGAIDVSDAEIIQREAAEVAAE